MEAEEGEFSGWILEGFFTNASGIGQMFGGGRD